LRREWTP
jgi:integrase